MFTIQQLYYFVTTVQLGSINKASKTLYISQPALTKQMLKLEEKTNCKLMERTHKGIELTEAGQYLYNQANTILGKLKETEQRLQNFQRKNTVRIGAIPSIANYYLPNFFYQKKLSFVPKVFIQDITQMLVDAVEQEQIDMAIVQDYDEILPLEIIHLFTERYLLAVPKNHTLFEQDEIHFQDFITYPIHMWHDPSDLRHSLRTFSAHYQTEPIFVDVSWSESLLAHTLQHNGITYIPEIVGRHIDTNDLKIKWIKPRAFGRKIQVIFKKEKQELVRKIFSEPSLFDTMPINSLYHY